MSVSTIEAFVENGEIRLPPNVKLPDRAKVYVVVPDIEQVKRTTKMVSYRLAHPGQIAEFQVEIIKDC